MFYATLTVMSRKYVFGFRSLQLPFKSFLETNSILVSCYPDHNEPKIICRFSKSRLEGQSMSANSLSHRIQKWQDIGGYWRTNIMNIFRTRFWTQGFPFVMRSRKAGLPSQHKSVRPARPSPPMSVRVRNYPSESANVRPSPPMSFRVRQCPSMSANVPKNTSVVS